MAKRRRVHSAEFKAKVALEAVRGVKTASELATELGVHPVQISQWKRKLVDEAPGIFSVASSVAPPGTPAVPELFEKIGRLEMELDWLKKKSAQIG